VEKSGEKISGRHIEDFVCGHCGHKVKAMVTPTTAQMFVQQTC
jgi:hypothetical protein